MSISIFFFYFFLLTKIQNIKSSQLPAELFTVKLTIDYKTGGCQLSKMGVFMSIAQRVGIQQPFQFGEAFFRQICQNDKGLMGSTNSGHELLNKLPSAPLINNTIAFTVSAMAISKKK